MAGDKPKAPRHLRAKVKWEFQDGSDISIDLVDQTVGLIRQFVFLSKSEDPCSRLAAEKNLRKVAEFCIAGQFFLNDQRTRRQDKPGSDGGIMKDTSRNERIRTAYQRADGERGTIKRLAIEFELSEKQISRIVHDLRT